MATYYRISSGITSSGIILSGTTDHIYVLEGAKAYQTILSGGNMDIYGGGWADQTTVNPGATFVLSSGGKATRIVENGGYVTLFDSRRVSFSPNAFSGELSRNATVHSGTTAVDINIRDQGVSLCVLEGGLANNVTLNQGRMFVSNGGIVNQVSLGAFSTLNFLPGAWGNNITVNTYFASFNVDSGAVVNGLSFHGVEAVYNRAVINSGAVINGFSLYGGSFNLSSGTIANDLALYDGARVGLSGTADGVVVNPGCSLYIGESAHVTGIVENGGYVTLPDSADVSFAHNIISGLLIVNNNQNATVHSGTTAFEVSLSQNGSLYVFSGGIADGTVFSSGGNLVISSGGTANNTLLSGGSMNISSGGMANGTVIFSGGALEIASGVTANDTVVSSLGTLRVASGGTANSTTAGLGGTIYVSSGGTALEILENGGFVSFDEDAEVSFRETVLSGTVLERQSASVHSRTLASGIVINNSGAMHVFSGGTANAVSAGGSLLISSGAVANEAAVVSGGSIYVFSGGTVNNTTVSGGEITVSGGVANDIIVDSGGIGVYGGIADRIHVSSGGISVSNDGVLTNATVDSGSISISSGGSASGIVINSGGMAVFSNAVLNDLVISGGKLNISSGGVASNVTIKPGMTVYIWQGALLKDAIYSGVSGEWKTINGVLSSAQIIGGLEMTVFGSACDVSLRGDTETGDIGRIYISSGGYAERITVCEYEQMKINGGGTAKDTMVNSGGTLIVTGGAVVNGVTVNDHASILVSSGAGVNGITVNDQGKITVLNGGSALNVEWTPFTGNAVFEENAYVTFTRQHSGVYYGSDSELFSHAMFLESESLSGSGNSMYVMSGGTATDITAEQSAILNVWGGGTMSNAVVSNGGKMVLSGGGQAISTTIGGYGNLILLSNGVASNTIMNSGILFVSSGGTANGIALSRGSAYLAGQAGGISGRTCWFYVSSGALADEITADEFFYLYVSSGGTATNATLNYRGNLRVFGGGTVSGVTVNSGGSLYVSKWATAKDIVWTPFEGNVQIEKGAEYSVGSGVSGIFLGSSNRLVSRAQSIDGKTLSSSEEMHVMSGGTADHISVSSGARLIVHNGGIASNVDWTPCVGDVSVERGGQVEFSSQYSGVYYGSSNVLLSNAEVLESQTIGGNGSIYVMSGGTANEITVNGGGYLSVKNGGAVNSTTISNGGTLEISSGGTANETSVTGTDAVLLISSGGVANRTALKGSTTLVVRSGVVVNETTVDGGATFIVESGGLANSFTGCGFVHISSGGTASNALFTGNSYSAGAYIHEGGFVDGAAVTSWGHLAISSGGTARSISVDSYSQVYVSDGGIVDGIVVTHGNFYVSSGGTALNIIECGGYVDVQEGAEVTFAPQVISGFSGSWARATLHSGTTAFDAGIGYEYSLYNYGLMIRPVIEFYGRLYVMSGGTVSEVYVHSGCTLQASGGVINSAVLDGGPLDIFSGGTANNTRIGVGGGHGGTTYGSLNVNSGGVANDTIASGYMNVFDGGFANRISAGAHANIYICDGGIANEVTIASGGCFSVWSGGTACDIMLSSGGRFFASKGAVVSGITVSSGANMGIASGASVFGTMLTSGASLTVVEHANIAHIIVNEYARMVVSSGGIAVNIVENGGYVDIQRGASVSFLSNTFSGGILSGGRSITVHSGTTATDLKITGGTIHVFYGGKVDDAVFDTGKLIVSSGGRLADITVNSGAGLDIVSGVMLSGALVMGKGVLTVSAGGMADEVNVVRNGLFTVSCGGTANAIIENGGYVAFEDGANISFQSNVFSGLTLGSSESATIHSGTTAIGVNVNAKGSLQVFSGGSLRDATVNEKGRLDVSGGGVVSGLSVTSDGYVFMEKASASLFEIGAGGYASVGEGTVIRGMTVKSGGSLFVTDESSFANVTVESGGRINGFLFKTPCVMESGMVFSGLAVSSGQSAVLADGQTGTDIGVKRGGILDVRDGAIMSRIVISSGGSFVYDDALNVADADIVLKYGAVVNQIKLVEELSADSLQTLVIRGGIISAAGSPAVISSGQSASGIVVRSRGTLNVQSGGVLMDTVISSTANVFVSSGAVLNGVVILSGANLQIEDYAAVENISLKSGGAINGIIANEDHVYSAIDGHHVLTGIIPSNQDAILYSGQTGSDMIVDSYGKLQIWSGAYAAETLVNGELIISGGSASGITIPSSGAVRVGNGCVLEEVTVNPGGNLFVSQGGSATIAFNPWQGNINLSDNAGITYLERDANVYLGGESAGLIGKSDSIASLNITAKNSALVYSGGTADHVYVNTDAVLYVQSGGTAVALYTPWNENAVINTEDGADITILDRDANVYCGNGETGVSFKADTLVNSVISSGNSVIVYEDGLAGDITIRPGGRMEIRQGGSAENVYVSEDGGLLVSNGAIVTVAYTPWNGAILQEEGADITYLTRDANVYYGGKDDGFLQKGNVFSGLAITSGNSVIVYEGGFAAQTIVNDSGTINILSGGSAEIAFNPWHGEMIVAEGGTITHLAREYNVYYGCNLSGLLGRYNEMSGLTISGGNSAIVYSDGALRDFRMDSCGYAFVSSGGMLENGLLSGAPGFVLATIERGGIASSIYVYGGAGMDVSGMAYDVVLSDGMNSSSPSLLQVLDSGYAEAVSVYENGSIELHNSGVARNVSVFRDGSATLFDSGVVSGASVLANGKMLVRDTASAYDLNVMSGGSLFISGNVNIQNTLLEKGAKVNGFTLQENNALHKELILSDLAVDCYDEAFLYRNQFAKNVVVVIDGIMNLLSGSYAESVAVDSDADFNFSVEASGRNIFLRAGARINNFTLTHDAEYDTLDAIVISGARIILKQPASKWDRLNATLYFRQTAVDTFVDSNAVLRLNSGATAEHTVLFGGQTVHAGGHANHTEVYEGGFVSAESNASLDGATVFSGGRLFIQNGVSAMDGIVVKSGGIMQNSYLGAFVESAVRMESGSILQGTIEVATDLVLEDGVIVSGANIRMDLANHAGQDLAFFSNMSSLRESDMTLAVGANQKYGTYVLGGNAADFEGTITVKSSSGAFFGQLSLAQPDFSYEINEYGLSLNESDELCLTIESCIPDGAVILLYKQGQLVASVESAYEYTLPTEEYDHMYVVSGGLVEGTQLSPNGQLTVMSGASAILTTTTSYGGTMNVLNGGWASDVSFRYIGDLNVVGGTVEAVYGGGILYVAENGLAVDVSVTSATLVAGGTMVSGEASYLFVSSGGILKQGKSSRYIAVYESGLAEETTVTGSMTVSSGGFASGTLVSGVSEFFGSRAGRLDLNGGVAKGTLVAGGTIYIASGGTALKTDIQSGTINISEGGLGLDTRLVNATMNVLSGGAASQTQLTSKGKQIVSKGGKTVGTVLSEGGLLLVSGSGSAQDIHALHNGAVHVSRFGHVEGITLDAYNMMVVSSDGQASDVDVRSKGYVYLRSGGILTGQIRIENGAVVSAYEGAIVNFDISRADSVTPLIRDLSLIDGTPDYTVTISADTEEGIYLLAGNAGSFDGTVSVQDTVLRYGTLAKGQSFTCGWNTYSLNLNNGVLSLTVSRNQTNVPQEGELIYRETVYDVLVHAGERIHVPGRHSFYEAVVYNQGVLIVDDDALAERTQVNTDGVLLVESGGSAFATEVNRNGKMEVSSGARASSILMDRGILTVSGGYAENINMNSTWGAGAGTVNIMSHGLVSNLNSQNVNIYEGELSNATVYGLNVFRGGIMESGRVYGVANVYGSGIVKDVTVYGGNMTVHEDGVVSDNRVVSSGTVTLSGGTAMDTALFKGMIHISSGGSALRTRITSGRVTVHESGFGLDTEIIGGGTQMIMWGGTACRTELSSNGSQIVSRGGSAVSTTLTRGGRLQVSRGGNASHVQTEHTAAVVVSNLGQAEDVTVNNYNMMIVSRNGRVSDANINSGAEVYLYQDAVLGGNVRIDDGAFVMAYDGSIVDFDLSKANGSTPLFNDLSRITGNPEYALTVSGEEVAVGTYLLADGADGFAQTVTVRNHPLWYGTLSLESSLSVGWNTFSLELSGGMLSLVVTRNAEEAPFTGEVVVDKTVYDAVIHTSETFNITKGFLYCEATVESRGYFIVPGEASVSGTVITGGGRLTVQSGGSAVDTHVNSGGLMSLLSGVITTSVTMDTNGGMLDVNGATASVVKNGTIVVSGNGVVSRFDNVWNARAENGLLVSGFAYSVVLSSGGTMRGGSAGGGQVYDGGLMQNVIIGGTMHVYDGGILSSNNLTGMIVLSGGTAEETNIQYGSIVVMSGGTAEKTRIGSANRQVFVSDGGLAADTFVSGGTLSVMSGGTAAGTEIRSSGSMSVKEGGTAEGTVVTRGGRLIVSHGGTARNTHAVQNAAIVVSRAGLAGNTTVEDRGFLVVSRYGSAADVTVKSGGRVFVYKDAVLGGTLRLDDGAVVSAYEGAFIDFSLALANASVPLIDNLGAVTGAPAYTVTVSAETEEGVYLLATGAADFTGTITVRDDTMRYGTLTVQNPLVYGWNTYALNLNDDALSLTVTRNDVYQEPVEEEPEEIEDEILEVVVSSGGSEGASGETLVWDLDGDILRVEGGAILSDTEVKWGGTLILEGNAILQGTIRLGTDVILEGAVNAGEADIEIDISERKEEYGTQINYLALMEANSYSVIVSPDQNKGEYILAGSADGFYGTITVRNTAGVKCGTLTLWSGILDYDVTRYTLCLSENNELVFMVSSPDEMYETRYILLYRNDRLVMTRDSVQDLLVATSRSKYDHMVVLDKGVAERIRIGADGMVTVEEGGTLTVSEQNRSGKLRFDYKEGDSTVIMGLNAYGAFSVYDNRVENVHGETVNVSGKVLIHDYHCMKSLTTHDGVEVTGSGDGGGSYFFNGTWIHDFTMSNATTCTFQDDTVVQNTEWQNVYYGLHIYEKAFFDQAVAGSTVFLHGGTIANMEFFNYVVLCQGAYISVAGDLFFHNDIVPDREFGGGYIDMNGHTAIFDYTTRGAGCKAMINLGWFSEDSVFQINLRNNQHIGTYGISTGFRGPYNICIDGTVVNVFNDGNMAFVYGDYSYVMNGGSMTIDVADDSDGSYTFVWYDGEGNMRHTRELSDITIDGLQNGDLTVRNGDSVLHRAILTDIGSITVRTGGQIRGLDQRNGFLSFEYAEDDSTCLTGVNPYGSFFVKDNVLENVYGCNISVSGNVVMHDYHGVGKLTTAGGVSISGNFGGGYYDFFGTTIKDFVLEAENTKEAIFRNGTWLDHATLNGDAVFPPKIVFNGGSTVSNTVFLTGALFGEGIVCAADIELNSGFTLEWRSVIELFGDLTLNANGVFDWDSCINVNGHTVNVNSGVVLSLSNFSEDANFRLMFQKDQKLGTYTIAKNAGSFIDYFLMNIGGVDTEELSFENPEMDYGNYHYTMSHDVETQLITLTIDVSENADETFGVYYWDSNDEEFYHSASVDGLDFSWAGYHSLTVRNHGVVRRSELSSGGFITVHAGGQVTDLTQYEYGRLRFNYAYGDATVINGINQYGSFFVEDNLMENVYGENVTVTGDVLIRNYHGYGGTMSASGARVTGKFDGGGSFVFSGSTVYDFTASGGRFFLREGTSLVNGEIKTECTVESDAGCIEDTVFKGTAYLNGGTYSNVFINGSGSIKGYIYLEGDLTIRGTGSIYNDFEWESAHAAIDARGNTITLDLSNRGPLNSPILNIDRVYNAELRVIFDQEQTIGTYTIGSSASNIGLGDSKGVYNWDTNKWDFLGATTGDMDGVISVYDTNGIEMAACTVNGETEYFGRYNFTAFVDNTGNLKLKVGWNNRDNDAEYFADELEQNDTGETATEITGSGAGAIPELTIDSDSDVDWFKFDLETVGRKSSYIGIDFRQWAGDLDMNLYNSRGELIDYARSVTNNERLSLTGHTAGTYYLKVYGYNGNRNSYSLVYNLPEPIQLDDNYEQGDEKEHAYFLKRLEETITVNASISRSDDKDFYMFILPERGLVSDVITLTYDDEFGDLDLYLYDQDGKTLLFSSTNTVGGQERITLAGLKHGVYYAEVKSKDGSVGQYQLVFDVNSRDVTPDKYENNNTLKKATKLYTLNGEKTLRELSIHSDTDVDYYSFSILENGSADDFITLSCVTSLGDLDIEILNLDGKVVAYSRTAENDDTVSLKGLAAGEYYIRVYGCNNVANNYSLSWHVTNSALIPSDEYEGHEPILIREDQTISGLSIAKVRKEDETREDTFRIVLDYDAWKRSKIILTDYRSDWEDGLSYVLKDADGNVLMEGIDSEISLYGLEKGEYYLTLDTPNEEEEYSEYSLIAQNLPDSDIAKDNTWSVFIYIAADNNLEGAFLQDLLYMQKAVLPENVEVYVLMDRAEEYAVAERNWTDTRVGKIRHSSGGAVAVQWMYFDGVNTDTYMNTHNLELRQEWNTGNVATLEAFLDWGMKVGRADNYALIMKDHGTSLGYNSQDIESGSIMAIKDIAELLKSDKYKDLSVVAFDQCLMGSDVVVTTMEGTVDYVVASEAVGYSPNLEVMYKVLLNSLETDMTPQEVSQKIVNACNCSGYMDLTMASFKTDENTLSSALEQFGELARGFTFADWVALCKCFSKVHNYGDEICAYSDLGSILNLVKGYHESISTTLLDAANALYDTVMNTVIDSTMITPDVYGTGLAVFNPIKSDPLMSSYTYGGGSTLDYYATDIGKTSWGEFMYTLSKLADEYSDYMIDTSGNLTFTSYTYYFEDGEIRNSYDLGAFNGNGVSFEGLYMDHAAYFNVTLEQAGIEGDAIVVTADNPDAEVTVYLYSSDGIRRISENGVLSLAGVDYEKAGVLNDYTLVITTTAETTYDLKFVGNWTNGVDFFDYSRAHSISPLAAGNNSIDKATQLPNGNYGGLVTCAGDKDYYKILSVYANSIDVAVKGTGLVVQEFNADGELLQTAVEEDGQYKLTVAKDNYVCVEGAADITFNECDPYVLFISDAAQMYLKAELNAMLPDKPVVTGELKDNQVSISVVVDDGLEAFYSKDMYSWLKYDDGLVATENDRYYFKAVDSAAGVESKYTSFRVVGIDKEPPTISKITADVTSPTNGDVTVTADISDNTGLESAWYRFGEDGDWLDYDSENGVTVKENTTVFFKAVDVAGNESEVVSYEVTNIDKTAPVFEFIGDNTTPLYASTLAAATEAGLDIYYSTDNVNWTVYAGEILVTANGTYFFKATDAAGNVGTAEYVFSNIMPFSDVVPLTQTWEPSGDALRYIVEYSEDNFEHVFRISVDSNSLDSFQLPAGDYQWRVRAAGGEEWTVGEPVAATAADNAPKLIRSDADGDADLFFAKSIGTWESGYLAQHVGSISDWDGTNEYAAVYGKNKLADIIEGSTDANILLMTDDENGDGLFVDDIYSALPGSVSEQQSRIARIDEIRAGFGNDIVDMTSQQFEYIGDGLTIRGGAGNDIIWANKGDNRLFGDAGNDRIVGASGNDVIAGGIGNDRMHGGGGNDVFTFCDNWGTDTVEQLESGSVTLWFASGDESNWNAETMTYTDGVNSVTVKGVTAEQITLKFGDDGSDQFATLSGMGAFLDATTERIFEESGKGILASL